MVLCSFSFHESQRVSCDEAIYTVNSSQGIFFVIKTEEMLYILLTFCFLPCPYTFPMIIQYFVLTILSANSLTTRDRLLTFDLFRRGIQAQVMDVTLLVKLLYATLALRENQFAEACQFHTSVKPVHLFPQRFVEEQNNRIHLLQSTKSLH